MGGYKVSIQFDKNFLNELRHKENSGVDIQKSVHHLSIHPIQLNDFAESVKDILNRGVARYNKELEGILLGYQNIKLVTNEGYIHNDSCFIHLDLQAEFFVFKPEIEKEMQGIVNRKSKDHVGLLVYNTFNVSIPKPESDVEWLGGSVNIGYEVLFKITYFKCTSYMPYIRGEILSVLKEGEHIVEPDEVDEEVQKTVSKRIIFDDEPEESPKKKSKKRKVDNVESIASEIKNIKVEYIDGHPELVGEVETAIKKIISDDEPEESLKKKSKKKKVDKGENIASDIAKIKVEYFDEQPELLRKEKKAKKKKEKKIKQEEEVSLSDLNLGELFNMTDHIIVKKEITDEQNFDNSCIEEKLSIKKSKKRRLTVTETDEIDTPKKRRKRADSEHY